MTGPKTMRELLEQIDDGGAADPVRRAQRAMRVPLPKRFYSSASAGPSGSGHGVFLDGKPVRTPSRQLLELPTAAAASLVVEEFAQQQSEIDPATMPVTRLANTVIDGIMPDPQPVLEDIVRFAASDLICYRAGTPAALAGRQARAWDPLIDWLRDTHGANFVLAEGVVHVTQPRETMAVFSSLLQRHAAPFRIGALHLMTALTGSAIIALAQAERRIDAEAAWNAALIDEDWNIEHWGEDIEAATRRKQRQTDFLAATRLLAELPV